MSGAVSAGTRQLESQACHVTWSRGVKGVKPTTVFAIYLHFVVLRILAEPL
jgi:hypothetical protein